MQASRAPMHRRVLRAAAPWLAMLLATRSMATDLTIAVHDHAGQAVEQSIVAVYPHPARALVAAPRMHIMDQVDKQFVPLLLAIRVGDQISFPNSDNIRHHVYSFSPARTFQLPLYRGIPSAPVSFAVAGKVVLGCNIHDRMSAHVYVLDTDLFALTAAGQHTFSGVPPGDYELAVFHPRQSDADDGLRHPLRVEQQPTQSVDVGIAVAQVQADENQGLSPLELKFQELRRGSP